MCCWTTNFIYQYKRNILTMAASMSFCEAPTVLGALYLYLYTILAYIVKFIEMSFVEEQSLKISNSATHQW